MNKQINKQINNNALTPSLTLLKNLLRRGSNRGPHPRSKKLDDDLDRSNTVGRPLKGVHIYLKKEQGPSLEILNYKYKVNIEIEHMSFS